jgi:hypothetical protein
MGVLLGDPVILLTAVLAYAAGDKGPVKGKYSGEFSIHGGYPGDITEVGGGACVME